MKRRGVERLMDDLVRAVPVAIAQAGLRPNACVLASRIGLEALRVRGVRARPVSVKLAVYNVPAKLALREGRLHELTPAQGGRVVVLGRGGASTGWDGHLVLVVQERYLLDLTSGQVRRLAEADGREPIAAEDAFWIEAREFARGKPVALSGEDGCLWVYEPQLEDRSFVRQPAWSAFRVQVHADQVISERQAMVPEGFMAPRVTVRLGGRPSRASRSGL